MGNAEEWGGRGRPQRDMDGLRFSRFTELYTKKGELYCIWINTEKKPKTCGCFLCWERDGSASVHTSVQRLYILCSCEFLFPEEWELDGSIALAAKAISMAKDKGGTWPENSNTPPLFVVLVQGSTRCAPGAKLSPAAVSVNSISLEHGHAGLFTWTGLSSHYGGRVQ